LCISKLNILGLETYDLIIAGGGCAGLSLAYHLHRMGDRDLSILIIDREAKRTNDRTWCFWSASPTEFEPVIRHSWSFLNFIDDKTSRRSPLGPYRYQMLRGDDFYGYVRAALADHPGVKWLQGRIDHLGEDEAGPYALVDGRRLRGRWLFNSCLPPRQISDKHYHLLQHFSGWLIETESDAFDPTAATLMDFRTPQEGDARFFYVLPVSKRQALVEYTVFSSHRLPLAAYEQALSSYIRDVLSIGTFTIREREAGCIPMTDAPFPLTRSPHIVNIGTAGGAVKPTTGYAFLRIQEQTRQIAARLLAGERPFWKPESRSRFRFYDTLLLHILQEEGQLGKSIFQALFSRNDFEVILRFLDEKTSVWQEAGIFASLPFEPFLRALLQTQSRSLRAHWYAPQPGISEGSA